MVRKFVQIMTSACRGFTFYTGKAQKSGLRLLNKVNRVGRFWERAITTFFSKKYMDAEKRGFAPTGNALHEAVWCYPC